MKVTERQKLNCGVSRLDRVRNEVVRARTGVRRELGARVDMNVLRWFGHVERMDNEQLLKKVMNVKVDGRSARRRPRFGWQPTTQRKQQKQWVFYSVLLAMTRDPAEFEWHC